MAIVRGIVNWYGIRDEDYVSPIIKGMKRYNNEARDRILDDTEIAALWHAADGQIGALVKLCLLTAQRRDKILTMEWTDINLTTGLWTIATAPREKGNAGILKLPQVALDIIRSQHRLAGNPYVFHGRNGKPYSNWFRDRVRLDEQFKTAPWRIHDLRRTARTLMSRAGAF